MSLLPNHKFKISIVAIFCAAMLFSCQNRLDHLRKITVKKSQPQTSGQGIDLHYTKNGKVKAHLASPEMLNFTQFEFPYREFPKGLKVHFYDDNGKKNTVIADYGIEYFQTKLVDLRGNVKVITADSTVLKAKQLYWDQEQNWVFTDREYTLHLPNGGVNHGAGFDANEKFDKFNSRSNEGEQIINESEE